MEDFPRETDDPWWRCLVVVGLEYLHLHQFGNFSKDFAMPPLVASLSQCFGTAGQNRFRVHGVVPHRLQDGSSSLPQNFRLLGVGKRSATAWIWKVSLPWLVPLSSFQDSECSSAWSHCIHCSWEASPTDGPLQLSLGPSAQRDLACLWCRPCSTF